MPINYLPKAGLGSVGSYQMSGRPWLTGSQLSGASGALDGNSYGEHQIKFPSITKSFTVINRSTNPIFIHFESRLINELITGSHHYVELPNKHDSFGFDVRCKEVYISLSSSAWVKADYELFAELTGIERTEMHPLSGSGINCAGDGLQYW